MEASMLDDDLSRFIYNSITYNTFTRYEKKVNPNIYLYEIYSYLKDYLINFKNHLLTKGTVYENLAESLEIILCSSRGSESKGIIKSTEMYDIDQSFWYCRDSLKINARYGPPVNAQFCKGFIGLKVR